MKILVLVFRLMDKDYSLCWPTTNRNCEVWSCDLSYLVFGLIWVGIVIGISLLLGTISYCILKYQRTQRKH
jgi:hypothetical protein